MTAPSPDKPKQLYLADDHRKMIELESGVDPAVRAERGYFSVTKKAQLKQAGFSDHQVRNLNVPGIMMPVHAVAGGVGLHIYRPDVPSANARGKLAKYVMPSGCKMALDVPPRVLPNLGDPGIPLTITEGLKKDDSAVSRGLAAIALLGVWNWRGRNGAGGKTALADWESVALEGRKVYLVFDSDVMEKLPVYRALVRLRDFLKSRKAKVRVVYLPSGEGGKKVGLDDWFAADSSRSFDDLVALSVAEVKPPPGRHIDMAVVTEVLKEARVSDELVFPFGYEVGPGGMTQVGADPFSEDDKAVQIARAPVIIGGRMEDLNDGSEYLVLQYPRHGRWRKVTVDRGTAMNARELVRLASQGLPVTSGRAGGLVEYLDAFESANGDSLPHALVSSTMGWQGKDGDRGFLCGHNLIRAGSEEQGSSDGVEEIDPVDWEEGFVSFRGPDSGDEQVAAAFRPGGSYVDWREGISPIASFPKVMLGFYAALVPPLLEILDASNFIVDFAHPTSRGKTTTIRILGSIYGCVQERSGESVVHPWKATRPWIDRTSSIMSGLPLILDETNQQKDPSVISETLYDVANGRGKGRASLKGTRRTGSWRTVLLSTGEYPAVNRSENGGTHARTLTITGSPFEGNDEATHRIVTDITDAITHNYGHAGPMFVRHLVENRDRWDEWREEFRARRREYAEKSGGDPVVARMSDYFASMDMAAKLADQALDLPWGYSSPVAPLYDDLVAQATRADRALEAMQMLAGWASAHEHEFLGGAPLPDDDEYLPRPPLQGWAGVWTGGREWDRVSFYPDRLKDILRRWDYDPESTLMAWRAKGFLDTGGDKKRVKKKVSIKNQKVWMVVIRRAAFEPEG